MNEALQVTAIKLSMCNLNAFHLIQIFNKIVSRDSFFFLASESLFVLTNLPPVTPRLCEREQNMTATTVIHFAMIRDFVICNYTEIYILLQLYTQSSFRVLVCHQNKAGKVARFSNTASLCAAAWQETPQKKATSGELLMEHTKKLGGYAIDVVEIFGTPFLFERFFRV